MQRTAAILAVVLCYAQPSTCDSGTYVQSLPLVDTPSRTPFAMPQPEVTLIELPEAEAEAEVLLIVRGFAAVP